MKRPPLPTLSIRGKLTLAALSPLVFVLLLVAFAVSYLINSWIVGETQKKVENDLKAAHEVYRYEQHRVRDIVRFTAHTRKLAKRLSSGPAPGDSDALESIREREGLDILVLTDKKGRVLHPKNVSKQNPPPTSFVSKALGGESFCGTVLMNAEQLRQESDFLADRAQIKHGGNNRKEGDPIENRGMVILCSTPVRNQQGKILGCLYGGILLNDNLALVDRIKDIVYGDETFEGTEVGSATIFLEDLRIATTIRLENGSRALGTRVSPEVAEAVLTQKKNWLARAKVVDKWYLTAYEPIFNDSGEAIGALYVGLLEKPFTALKIRSAIILLWFLLLGSGVGYLMARFISKRLSRPLLELDLMAQKVAEGERDICLHPSTHDEIGHLTGTFNRMAASLKEREDELNLLNLELGKKVMERTALLEEERLKLIKAQEELVRAEKLAAIGSLAAGVAHEINNPAAIIRGNVEILMMELAPDAPGREEAEEILKQTERISLITQNMLTFAREQAFHTEQVQVNELLDDILGQISHQVSFGDIQVKKEFAQDLPPLPGDSERLRQVFTNLLINALQAMKGAGTLIISTEWDEREVKTVISDTGPGIPLEIKAKIFNPFFTTKSKGTGLGLSVSYGIIKSLGGSIKVESEEGKGTSFQVTLLRREESK